jgi:hypothetical protein
MSYRTFKRAYLLLAVGVFLGFFGHGAWAAFENFEKFRGLLSDSLNNVFGTSTTIEDGGIVAAVYAIGWVDILFSLGVLLLGIGVYKGHGALTRFASSRIVMAAYMGAIFWGFTTAAARMTAAGEFYPEVWDLVERGPNFMLPAALLFLTFTLHRPAELLERQELPGESKSIGAEVN